MRFMYDVFLQEPIYLLHSKYTIVDSVSLHLWMFLLIMIFLRLFACALSLSLVRYDRVGLL